MINGNARNNGVSFSRSKYSVHFSMEKDLSYKVHISENLSGKVKAVGAFRRFLYKIPFIRGIVMQMEQNKAFSLMLLIVLIWDIVNIFGVEEGLENSDGFYYITLVIVVLMLAYSLVYLFKKVLFNLKSTLQFHGAEHKVINAYLNGSELSFENVKNASRVSRWCGTELMVFFLVLFVLCSFVLKYDSLIFLISFSVAYEIFNLKNGDELPVLNILFKLGYFCQEKIVTREPSKEQLEASIESFKMLLKAEREGI